MDENAVFELVDLQLSDPRHGVILAASLLRIVKEKGRDKAREEYLILADIAEKAMKQMEGLVYKLLKDKLEEKARELAKIMVEGRWTHDYPITIEEVRRLEIPLKTEMPAEVYQLMEPYPQPATLRPSVEYVPAPRTLLRSWRGK